MRTTRTSLVFPGVVLALAAAASTAKAGPVTFNFAGIITVGQSATGADWTGDTITGSYSVDPTLLVVTSTDGTTFADGQSLTGALFGTPNIPAIQVSILLPDGTMYQDGAAGGALSTTVSNTINRDFGDAPGSDAYEIEINDITTEGPSGCAGALYQSFLWEEEDSDYSASTLFPDALGGVSFTQQIGLEASQLGYVSSTNEDTGAGYSFYFELTSLNPAPTPEPSSWLLLCGGLVVMGLLARRRPRQFFAA